MKGLQIFVHSVRLVFSNLDAAVRISLVPYLISGLAMVALALPGMRAMGEGTPQALAAVDAGVWVNFIAYVVIYVIATLWVAVAWHRYVLVEEYPNSWIAPFHGGLILSYFLKGILITLLLAAIALVVSLVLGLAIGWMGALGAVIVGAGSVAVPTYVFYRLCAVLPSAAVGKPMRLGEAWEATNETGSTIFVLVVLVLIASLVSQLPATLGAADSAFAMIYSFIVGWVSMLIGVSVLTTFYGHFVEGRSID